MQKMLSYWVTAGAAQLSVDATSSICQMTSQVLFKIILISSLVASKLLY